MSEGIDAYIKKKFEVPDVDIRTYSPLTLAYIGDGVFDLVIRSVVVGKGNTRPNQLHHRTSQIVKAIRRQLSYNILNRCLRRKKRTSIAEDAMPSRQPWQKMQRWQITVRQRGWRHWWDICI